MTAMTAITAITAIASGLKRRALDPVDGASTSAFRILFGIIGLTAVVRFFAYGWIDALYLAPAHHFTYAGFAWAQPWPGWGMYAHFAALGLLSIGIAAGYRWRWCAALFAVGFTYVELLDQTTYLNHYYLVSLLALLLAVLPRDGRFVPRWAYWTLRFQVGVVYGFAGLAKLNPDWLLQALPLRIWLYQHGDLPAAGPLLAAPAAAYAMSWAGIIALALFVLMQIALPLRHYAYPGNVRWNEQGYRFAWRVMLSEKTGFVQYRVRCPDTGQTWLVFPDAYLTPLQTERMAIQPDLILQTARIIAADYAA